MKRTEFRWLPIGLLLVVVGVALNTVASAQGGQMQFKVGDRVEIDIIMQRNPQTSVYKKGTITIGTRRTSPTLWRLIRFLVNCRKNIAYRCEIMGRIGFGPSQALTTRQRF